MCRFKIYSLHSSLIYLIIDLLQRTHVHTGWTNEHVNNEHRAFQKIWKKIKYQRSKSDQDLQINSWFVMLNAEILIDEKLNHPFPFHYGMFEADGDSPPPTAAQGILLIVFLISELSSKPLNKLVTLICLQFNWKIKQICRINLLLNSIGGTREILSQDFCWILIAIIASRKGKDMNLKSFCFIVFIR